VAFLQIRCPACQNTDVIKHGRDTIKVYSVPLPTDNSARGEVPLPSYEEVTQRAGSLRALTGLTDAEVQA
jgi:hypothetical protein